MKTFLIFGFLFLSAPSFGASRVISLSPAITEIIFDMGLQNRLVGTSQFSDFPEEAKSVPNVGPYSKPNLEKIIALHPDLILIPTEGSEDIQEKLKRQKLPFQILKMQSLDEIPAAAVIIGDRLDNADKGFKFSKIWSVELNKLFPKDFKKTVPALITVQSDPLITVGKGTFLNEIVKRCGGDNVYENLQGYPKVSRESLLNKKFNLLLMVEKDNSTNWAEKLSNMGKAHVKTVQVDPDIATRPGPRLLKGIEKICEAIKGQRDAS